MTALPKHRRRVLAGIDWRGSNWIRMVLGALFGAPAVWGLIIILTAVFRVISEAVR